MDVKITFRGLCAFVPSSEIKKDVPVDWLGVMLVNANEDSQRKFKKLDLNIHHTLVKFNLNDIEGLKNSPDASGYWELHEEDVVLVTGNEQLGVNVKIGEPDNPRKPTPEEEDFFNWISSVEEILPTAGSVRLNCFEEKPDEGRVAVRIHISEGDLTTARVGKYDDEPVILQFHPPGPDSEVFPRAATTKVALDIYDVKGPFKIRARRFGGASFRELVFKNKKSMDPLEIDILNICSSDFSEAKFGPKPYPGLDEDFRWYYILSQALPNNIKEEALPIPVAVEFNPKSGQGGREPARCANALFAEATTGQVASMMTLAAKIRSAT
jgi:hypothetical protein